MDNRNVPNYQGIPVHLRLAVLIIGISLILLAVLAFMLVIPFGHICLDAIAILPLILVTRNMRPIVRYLMDKCRARLIKRAEQRLSSLSTRLSGIRLPEDYRSLAQDAADDPAKLAAHPSLGEEERQTVLEYCIAKEQLRALQPERS